MAEILRAREFSSVEDMKEWIEKAPEMFAFVGGCFDPLAVKQVHMLQQAAAAYANCLVVGVRSDESVRKLKGPGHPHRPYAERVYMLTCLRFVDAVIRVEDPLETILLLKPDILIESEVFGERDVVGAAVVEARGGQVVRLSPAK